MTVFKLLAGKNRMLASISPETGPVLSIHVLRTGWLITTMFLWMLPALPAQDTTATSAHKPDPSSAHIAWIGQFPDSASAKDGRGFGERAGDFLFGRRDHPVLTRPVAVVALNQDNYWAVDQENGLIFRVESGVGEITHFKNKNYRQFVSLVGICHSMGGEMLFTDSGLGKIFRFMPDKRRLEVINDTLVLQRPTGIAFFAARNEIWVVETTAHRISVIDRADGRVKSRIGTRGTGPGQFNFPTSIWIDHSGKVYVVDAMNFRIQVFNSEGTFMNLFGKAGDAAGTFARPKGIAADSFGNIYVADALFHNVQVFDATGKLLYLLGNQGHHKGEFWMPSGIYIDDQDNIFVADSYNGRVQVFNLNPGL